jgi:hypothetical protein
MGAHRQRFRSRRYCFDCRRFDASSIVIESPPVKQPYYIVDIIVKTLAAASGGALLCRTTGTLRERKCCQ